MHDLKNRHDGVELNNYHLSMVGTRTFPGIVCHMWWSGGHEIHFQDSSVLSHSNFHRIGLFWKADIKCLLVSSKNIPCFFSIF